MDVAQSALTRFVVGRHARMTVLADCCPSHRQQSAKSCLLEPAEIDPTQSSLTIELTGLNSRSGKSGGMMVSPKICTCL